VFDSSNALLGTLADILDFSVLNEGPEGALPLRKEPVCLQHALEGVAEMVSPTAAAKGLELCVLLDQELWGRHFMGDATRVRQVIHQLVSNAVKFTERGQVLVHAQLVTPGPGSFTSASSSSSSLVGLPASPPPQAAAAAAAAAAAVVEAAEGEAAVAEDQQQKQPPATGEAGEAEGSVDLQQPAHEAQPLPGQLPPGLYIHIHDSGIGISPSQLPHLFDCFKQAHGDTMSRKYGGTGLGLALSKRLAQAMHGDIYVSSVAAQGSKFTFALHPQWCAPQAQPLLQQQQHGVGQQQQQSVRMAATAAAAAAVPAAGVADAADEACGESDTPTAASTDLRLTKSLCRYASGTTDGLSTAAAAATAVGVPPGKGGDGSAGSSRGSPGRGPIEPPLTPPIGGAAGPPGVSCSSFCLEGYAHSCGSSWYDGEGDTGRCYQCYPPHREEVEGRRVLVDVRHPALAAQTCQLLQQLGLQVVQLDGLSRKGSSCQGPSAFLGGLEEEGEGQGVVGALGPGPADAPLGLLFNRGWSGDDAISRWLHIPGGPPARPCSSCSTPNSMSKPYESSLYGLSSSSAAGSSSSSSVGPGMARVPAGTSQAPPSSSSVADVAVVSSCRLAAALRTGWKGRPLLVLGDPQEVPEKLHPLVVMVSKPLKLAKLAAALSKAAAMLSWSGGLQPRLGRLALVAPAAGLGLGAGGGGSRRGYTGARSAAAAAAAAAAAGTGWPEELSDSDMYVRRASIDNSVLVKRAPGRQGLPGLPPVPGAPAAAAAGQRGSPLSPAAAAVGATAISRG
jgi:hypothetical protein